MASRPIDEKIVKLTLDTKTFINNASEAINSFTKMNDTFNGNRTTLSSMANGIESIANKFSALGVIGATVLTDLTRKAESFIAPILSFGIGGIIDGGLNRAMRLEDAYFKLGGLGADVKAVMDDVDYGVSGTAYSLDAAATVAAQLTASGMEAGDQMKGVLRGISGVAAMTSSTYEDIGSIYTTVAGNGKLMTEQLRQLSSRGMNASATMAKVFNTIKNDGETSSKALTDDVKKSIKALTGGVDMTEEKMNELVSKGKIGFAEFSAVMDEAFGEHAKEANKTFQGAMSNVRAALAKIGQAFFTPLIQNEGPVVNLLNAIREKLNGFKDSVKGNLEELGKFMGEFINKFADAINNIGSADSAITHVTNIIKNLWTVLKNIGAPIAKAFANLIPHSTNGMFTKFLTYLDEMTSKLANLDMSKWNAFWDKMASYFSNAKSYISSLATDAGNLIGKLKDLNIVGTALKGGALIWVFDKLFTFAKTSKFLGQMASALFQLKFATEKTAKTGNVIGNLTGALRNIGAGLKMVGVGIFVLAIKQVAEGIKILSEIDGEAAIKAIGILGVVMIEIELFASSLNKAFTMFGGKNSFGRLIGISALLLAFSKSMNGISEAMKKIGSLSTEELVKSLVGIALVAAGLTKFAQTLEAVKIKASTTISIMLLAASMDLISFAIMGLAKIDSGALYSSILGLGLALGELVAAVYILAKIEKPMKTIAASGSILLLATSLDLIAIAIAGLSMIDGPKLLETIMYLGAAIFELVAAVFVLSNIEGPLKSLAGGATMIMLAFSLDLLTVALAGLSMIDGEKLGVSLMVMAGAFSILAGAAYVMQEAVVGILALVGAAIALALVSVSLTTFAAACKVLETIDWTTFGEGMFFSLGKLAAGIALMGIALPGAIALSAAGIGLLALGAAVKMLDGVDMASVTSNIAPFLLGLSLGLVSMTMGIPGALALLIASPALIILAKAIESLVALDMASITGDLTLLLLGLGAGLTSMIAALPGAIALLVVGPALLIFSKALTALQGIKIEGYKKDLMLLLMSLAAGLTAMIAALPGAAALMVAAPALVTLSKALKAYEKIDIGESTKGLAKFLAKLAGALTLMDAALPGAEALKTAAPALTDLAAGLTALMALDLEKSLSVISQLTDSLAEMLVTFTENQNGAAAVGTLADNLTKLDATVSSLQSNSKDLASALSEIKAIGTLDWNSYFSGIQTAVDSSIASGLASLKSGLDSINTTISTSGETFVTLVTDCCTKIVDAFTNTMTQMTSNVTTAASDLVSAAGKSLDNGRILANQSGGYFAEGFANGIKNKTYLAVNAANAMGKSAYDELVKSIKQGSPSKLTTESGEFFGDGFINGINSKLSGVKSAAGEMGSNALGALNKLVDQVNSYLNNELTLSPVITPVLDLSAMDDLRHLAMNSMIDTSGIDGIQNGRSGQSSSSDTVIENVEVSIEINASNGLSPDEIARIARKETEDVIVKEVRKIAIARR